jgi:hypothetical protein
VQVQLELPHVNILTKCDLADMAEVDKFLDLDSASLISMHRVIGGGAGGGGGVRGADLYSEMVEISDPDSAYSAGEQQQYSNDSSNNSTAAAAGSSSSSSSGSGGAAEQQG